jgi:TRAP-type mannitol/chloroaromatic compound transport system permease large subunit
MLQFQGQPMLATFVAMALLLACAFVLDAFELIFLVVPIVMPPLLAQVGDAAWVAVLALLVLQAGFLLPPFGYAVVLARGAAGSAPPASTSTSTPVPARSRPAMRAMAQALMPYLAWLACVLALVAAVPQITMWLRTAPLTLTTGPAVNNDDVERMMRAMSQRPESASAPSR